MIYTLEDSSIYIVHIFLYACVIWTKSVEHMCVNALQEQISSMDTTL